MCDRQPIARRKLSQPAPQVWMRGLAGGTRIGACCFHPAVPSLHSARILAARMILVHFAISTFSWAENCRTVADGFKAEHRQSFPRIRLVDGPDALSMQQCNLVGKLLRDQPCTDVGGANG